MALLNARELVDAHGRLDVHHVVLVSRVQRVIELEPGGRVALPRVLCEPVQALDAHFVVPLFFVRAHHAALARDQILGGVERECGDVANGADFSIFVNGLDGVRGVFDDEKVMFAREIEDGVHVAGSAGEVHGDDGARAGGDFFRGGRGVEVHGTAVDVREHGHGAAVHDHVGRGRERERRHYDLVTRADAQNVQREIQPGRARVERQPVLRAHVFFEFLLEPLHARPRADPAAA